MTGGNAPPPAGGPGDLRARAEETARRDATPRRSPGEAPSAEELQRLVHELQVHEVELEMQNEELRRAQSELEVSRARYFDLYDLAPVGYLTLDELGSILEANLTAAALLGIERGRLLAQPLARHVATEDQEVWRRQAGRILESGDLVAWEMRLTRGDGGAFWARLEAIAGPDPATGQRICRLALSDIAEHRRLGEALQESEERYRVIVESARDLIFFLSPEGGLRWSNEAARGFVDGVRPDEDLFRRVHPADAPRVAAAWRAARSGERGRDTVGYRLRGGDGRYRTLESSFRRISLAGEELWCVISTDTTELTKLRRNASAGQGIPGMVGRDPKMLELAASIRELADEEVPVLILGESGTGKELIASAIHTEGSRAAKNFVAINCGAIPDTLLETELFGHVKGSFTGAHRDKKGRFELADGGTIFLDEVGELSLAMQVKLLRVLQEGTFEKVGGEEPCRVDVRLISATNKDLKQEVKDGRFREDLFYRISVVPLEVPPLRARLADIPLLVEHIIEEEARRSDRRRDPARAPRKVSIARETLALLLAHRWPGNIRELQNVLRFALIKCKGNLLEPEHLPPTFAVPAPEACRTRGRKAKITAASAREALEQAGGHPGEAARRLGVSRSTFYRHVPKKGPTT
ncbi:MAG TPA: sigma-54-dependent Fis family transcriptional regulator [bacterium]